MKRRLAGGLWRAGAHGFTLGGVLLLIFIAMMFAFSLAALATMHLSLATRNMADTKARNLAESTMAIAVARVMDQASFGADPTDPTASVVLLDNGTQLLPGNIATVVLGDLHLSGEAVLTFDVGEASRLGIPYCTNNVQSALTSPGWTNRIVPGDSLHLTAVGHYGQMQVEMEALIITPPFPYCVAASGTILSTGSMLAASIPAGSTACIYSGCGLNPCYLAPGSVGSNSTACPAITLGPSTINGNVDAVGGISLAGTSKVKGEVVPHHATIPIPPIDIASQFARVALYPGVQSLPPGLNPSMTLSGLCQCQGDFTVTGDLTLDNAVLYVSGSLDVKGGLKGNGAILIQGAASIEGCSTLATDDSAALVAGGPITIQGSTQQTSYFQGIVYSGTSIDASDVTVLGTMVADTVNNPCGCGKVTLANTTVVRDPRYLTLQGGSQVGVGASTNHVNFLNGSCCCCSGFLGLGIFGSSSSCPGGCLKGLGLNNGQPNYALNITGVMCPCGTNVSQVCIGGRRFSYPLCGCKRAVLTYLQCQLLPNSMTNFCAGLFQPWRCQVIQQISDIVDYHTTSSHKTTEIVFRGGYMVQLDLNQFIALADQMRVAYWEQLDPTKPFGH